MIKIALSGKAKSGKDTFSLFLQNNFQINKTDIKANSFAKPMKQILEIMFPQANKENLFGESPLREAIISENLIDSNENQLTYRRALTDLGAFARKYNPNVWIDCLNFDLQKSKYKKVYIINDLRFENELKWAKENGFISIRIIRDESLKSNCKSETEQDGISNDEFDFIIDNNSSLNHLNEQAIEIVRKIKLNQY